VRKFKPKFKLPHRPAVKYIKSDLEWRAISSAARDRIIDAFSVGEPCSVTELARRLDCPADSLYHHIRILEKAKLIEKVGCQYAGRTKVAVYAQTAETFLIDFDNSDVKLRQKFARFIRLLHKNAGRTITEAIEAGLIRTGRKRTSVLRWDYARLSENDVDRLVKLWLESREIITKARCRQVGKPYLFCEVLCPLASSRT
jgi:DNA-binding transcriptional ArsR family regulator